MVLVEMRVSWPRHSILNKKKDVAPPKEWIMKPAGSTVTCAFVF